MNTLVKIVGGLLIVALGAGIVIYCDSQGFFKDKKLTSSSQICTHQLESKKCFICNPELVDKLGKCPTHDLPNAICTFCDASLMPAFKTQNDWCKEHDVPESQCVKCNPKIATKFKDLSTVSKEQFKIVPKDNWLRDANKDASACEVESNTIQFTSPLTAQKAGLEYQSVVQKPYSKSISCPVSIHYDANQYAQITAKTAGFIVEVKKELGSIVKAGETLAYIKSNELNVAKAELLQAHGLIKLNQNNYDREKKLVENLASTEFNLINAKSKLLESEIAFSLSKQKLLNFDLTEDKIKSFLNGEDKLELLPLTTPIAGVILERHIHNGESIEVGNKLFSVSDISKMWALLDVYESNAFEVKVGQKSIITIDNLQGEHWDGVISWVSTQIDASLRTLKARVEISNQASILKAGMTGQAKIKIADEKSVLFVPKTAAQWDGCCHVVFVKISDFIIEPRKIKITSETQELYVVTGNIKAGENVITTGSFLMKTEISKGSIGAGCCE